MTPKRPSVPLPALATMSAPRGIPACFHPLAPPVPADAGPVAGAFFGLATDGVSKTWEPTAATAAAAPAPAMTARRVAPRGRSTPLAGGCSGTEFVVADRA